MRIIYGLQNSDTTPASTSDTTTDDEQKGKEIGYMRGVQALQRVFIYSRWRVIIILNT